MKSFIANRYFEYHGNSYTEGDIVEAEDHVVEKLCKRGYGTMKFSDECRIDEIPIEKEERKTKSRRKRKKKE